MVFDCALKENGSKSPILFLLITSLLWYQQRFEKAEERESGGEVESISVAVVDSEVKLFVVSFFPLPLLVSLETHLLLCQNIWLRNSFGFYVFDNGIKFSC